jgi:hypothetical protein
MKDIEHMAREAGFDRLTEWREGQPAPWVCTTKDLARFAALVVANSPPQTFMSYKEGYAAGVTTAMACAVGRS